MADSCALVLQDGTIFYGTGYGAKAPRPEDLVPGTAKQRGAGEVVFNTGMSGYHEILTDPSYTGQIVVMTYPLIGNYGCDTAWNEVGPETGREARTIKPNAFVTRSLYRGPVPPGRQTLDDFLRSEGIPGIDTIDTRKLTLRLRDGGAAAGVIVSLANGKSVLDGEALKKTMAYLNAYPSMEGSNLIQDVGTTDAEVFNADGKEHFVLVDCGIKANIIRELVKLGIKVTLLPSTATAAQVLACKPDALLLSSGPGDPAVLVDQVAMARELMQKIPVFGICLGHQLIAQALGAKTYKLQFGHHGVNQPVVDLRTSKVYVTSQNHGFAVDEKTLPAGLKVWFRNANDQTNEGLYHETMPVMCAQFHPEAAPGPRDTTWIFAAFLERLKQEQAKKH